MFQLFLHLEMLHLSITTIASGTGLLLGTVAGRLLPTGATGGYPR